MFMWTGEKRKKRQNDDLDHAYVQYQTAELTNTGELCYKYVKEIFQKLNFHKYLLLKPFQQILLWLGRQGP